jgi:hypothetical protein
MQHEAAYGYDHGAVIAVHLTLGVWLLINAPSNLGAIISGLLGPFLRNGMSV